MPPPDVLDLAAEFEIAPDLDVVEDAEAVKALQNCMKPIILSFRRRVCVGIQYYQMFPRFPRIKYGASLVKPVMTNSEVLQRSLLLISSGFIDLFLWSPIFICFEI